MITWQLWEARQRFSRLVQAALDGTPQFVTRRGKGAVVIISVDEYRRLTGPRLNFKEFLLSGPDLSALDLERLG
jgi:prevent-host-death family protein